MDKVSLKHFVRSEKHGSAQKPKQSLFLFLSYFCSTWPNSCARERLSFGSYIQRFSSTILGLGDSGPFVRYFMTLEICWLYGEPTVTRRVQEQDIPASYSLATTPKAFWTSQNDTCSWGSSIQHTSQNKTFYIQTTALHDWGMSTGQEQREKSQTGQRHNTSSNKKQSNKPGIGGTRL